MITHRWVDQFVVRWEYITIDDEDAQDSAAWLRLANQARGTAIAGGSTYIQRNIAAERYLGLPSDNAATYKDDSPTTNAAKLKGRLLIAQGTGDDNVHMANTIQFIQPLIDAGIPKDKLVAAVNSPLTMPLSSELVLV